MRNLQEAEQLNPNDNQESRRKFLSNFDWKDSMLQQHEIKRIESLLVEIHDTFAGHRFDIGINEEFTVKLTPKDDSPAYSQSLPTPVKLKEDILVELASLHKYGIITILPFSKYAKVLIYIMTKHSYLPTTLITNKRSAFTSTIVAEITQILGVTLECATTKHPQTIDRQGKIHAFLKTNLKIASGNIDANDKTTCQ